jgi:penicillin amidase
MLVGDDIGPQAIDMYQGKFSYVSRFLAGTLTSNDSPWCDDGKTIKRDTCDEIVAAAFHAAVGDLQRRLGNDVSRWRWDAVHLAMFPHTLGSVDALRSIFSRSIGIPGDWSTVNVGVTAADHPYEAHTVPGYREIIDLSPANDSRFIDAVGESGHPLSNHYDDFMKDWRAVAHRKMRMDRGEIDRGALGHLRLMP